MNVFEIDRGLTFWALVTFGCLFAVLARFVFKPLQRMLDEREQRILRAVSEAEKARAQADALLESNRQQVEEAREEARRIIREGHRIVATMKQELTAGAKRDAQRIAEEARVEIDRELRRGLEELKSTVVHLALRISRQIVGEQCDADRHEQLADEFIERLKQRHVRKPTR